MKTLTHTPATKGQIRQITRVGSDAIEQVLEELGISKDGAQRVHASGDEFAKAIHEVAKAKILDLSVTDKYKNEEVESSYGYLSGYKKPRGITEQTNRLRELIPGVGYADEQIAQGELPKNAEGWFAIPKWQSVAPTYAEAVQKVFNLIKETRGKFYNYRDGQITNERLRQSEKTRSVLDQFAEAQKGHDILVIPAQFGILHRGRSVRRALEVMTDQGQFGLGAFTIGIMLLTHPERLENYDDLWIDCSGDEFDDPGSVASFDLAPYFYFLIGKVRIVTCRVDNAHVYCGSASGFVPQS